MKNHLLFTTVIIGLFLLGFASCKKNKCSNSEKATFKDATGIGGCGMVVELKNGKYLEPKNLSEMNLTPKDGMKIWVSYTIDNSGGTNCMMGKKAVINCLKER